MESIFQLKTEGNLFYFSREDVPSTLRPRPQQPEYTPPSQSSRPQNWNREKNKYGDVWEE